MEIMEITVLLTGITGFLGSHLSKRLLEDGYTLIGLKRSFSNEAKIPKKNGLKLYDSDKTDLKTIFNENKIDVIIHTATNYGRPNNDFQKIVECNLLFPVKLLELCQRFGVKTFFNTDTFYSKFSNYNHLMGYSLSKRQFLEWMQLYSQNMRTYNIRLEHLYGENDNETKFIPFVINKLLENAEHIELTEGSQKRDFIYIKDVVEFFLCLLNNLKALNTGFHTYEIGTGKSTTIKKLVTLIKMISGNKDTALKFGSKKLIPNEIRDSTALINNTYEDFGWTPKYTLEEGIKNTIEWYKHNRM